MLTMSDLDLMPDTSVLAIASHVVYGYVGNSMATFVMQSLGLEVSSLHTVNFSNHGGYYQLTGSKATDVEILELYAGLKQSHLTDFDVLLSGYAPSAAAVKAIGKIAQELKQSRDLFWVMDPVMGDNGKHYVSEDVVPAYKTLLPLCDLILPNQFEAEILSETKITDLSSLIAAITSLHRIHRIPHIIVTSVRFPFTEENEESTKPTLSVVGSTIRTDGSSRLFRITVPEIDAYFSGTGDMFAALMVARFREACMKDGLCQNISWLCADNIPPLQTPLARAAEKVCASLCTILAKTKENMDQRLAADVQSETNIDTHLRKTKAAEVRVPRFQKELRDPVITYRAEEVVM